MCHQLGRMQISAGSAFQPGTTHTVSIELNTPVCINTRFDAGVNQMKQTCRQCALLTPNDKARFASDWPASPDLTPRSEGLSTLN